MVAEFRRFESPTAKAMGHPADRVVAESGRFESPTANAMAPPSEGLTRYWAYPVV